MTVTRVRTVSKRSDWRSHDGVQCLRSPVELPLRSILEPFTTIRLWGFNPGMILPGMPEIAVSSSPKVGFVFREMAQHRKPDLVATPSP